MKMTEQKNRMNAVCNTCTLALVRQAYKRVPWFRLVREPLKLGMRFFSWVYRVDPAGYTVRTPHCYGCIRFYKVALKDRSRLFNWLNQRVNPVFDSWLEGIVAQGEIQRAKDYARRASAGEVTRDEAVEWMKDQKTGF